MLIFRKPHYSYSALSVIFLLCCITFSPVLAQLGVLNDEFTDGVSIDNWLNVNTEEGWQHTQLEAYNINDSIGDNLFMLPLTESWYGEYKGAYLYKMIVGDFVLTSKVTATARDGFSLPSSSYSLAGIMIREPVTFANQDPENEWIADEQNYIFLSIGQATGSTFNFEIKNALLLALTISFINTIVEIVSTKGIDNISVPMATILMLYVVYN